MAHRFAYMTDQRGVGMVEILIALLVMSIGLLGYAGLQLRALNSTEEAHYRTQAIAIAQDLAERIAANPQSMAAYTTAGNWAQLSPVPGKPMGWDDCVLNPCTPDQMAQLKSVAEPMIEEWSATKKAPRHAAWLHEKIREEAK